MTFISQLKEISISLVPLTLGVCALVLLPGHDFFSQGFPDASTPDFFPSLIGMFLILLGLLMLVFTKQSELIDRNARETMLAKPVFQTCIIFLLYWLILNQIGFVLSSVMVILALSYVFEQHFSMPLLTYSILLPIIVYFVFKKSANVYLPTPTWF